MKDGLKYKVIKSEEQYFEYCDILMDLLEHNGDEDHIELLELLIEVYDQKDRLNIEEDPIALLKLLLAEHKMQGQDLARILDVEKGTVSNYLHYRRALSKKAIRKISEHFKVSQDAFNRPYDLVENVNTPPSSLTPKRKKIRSQFSESDSDLTRTKVGSRRIFSQPKRNRLSTGTDRKKQKA